MTDAPLFPAWTAWFGFLVGAFVGSFLNMAIYRLPRRLSFSEPRRSFCPRCRHPLAAVDLVPIGSWLATGGRCRYCRERIAARYLVVELVTAAIFAGLWWRFVADRSRPDFVTFGFFATAASALVMIIFIDWELYIIPDELNAFLLVVALAYAAAAGRVGDALWGALLGWGVLWGIAFFGRIAFGKDAMGHGDIKMMRAVGALLGPVLLLANVAIAVVLGLVVGVALILVSLRSRRSTEEANADDAPAPPEPIGSLVKLGAWYLLALDVPALFFPRMYAWIGETPEEESIEESDWTPSITTIPFGPYLAAGAIASMLFGNAIETSMRDYWDGATGARQAARHATLSDGRALSKVPTRKEKLAEVWNKGASRAVSVCGESGADCA